MHIFFTKNIQRLFYEHGKFKASDLKELRELAEFTA